MTADPYSAEVRELFADLEHAGDLDNAAVTAIDDQGVRIRLAARYGDGRLQALRFRAWGCPHLLAACEAFCRDYEGRPVADLGHYEAGDIMGDLSIPAQKTGRILVLEDAVRSLGRSICGSSVPHIS